MKPNIIYIHTHDTGRCIQPYGHPVKTPNLQRFAEEATVFRKAFCAGPTCSPSRAALLTGQMPHSNGMLGLANLGWSLNHMEHHLQNTLKQGGYRTALAGIQHICEDDSLIGYDDLITSGKDNPDTDRTTSYVREYLQHHPKAPFFLSIGLWETHRHKPYPSPSAKSDPRWTAPAPYLPDTSETRYDMARFNAAVMQADRKIGEVLDTLDELALSENTIVVITTDHGIGHPWMKCNLSDGGLGVMLLIRGPGFGKGEVCDALVSHIDLYPTLCEIAGVDIPAHVQGKSLMPVVKKEQGEVNDVIFGEITWHVSYEPQRCVRDARYKYVKRFGDRQKRVLPNTDDGPGKDYLIDRGWDEYELPGEALYDTYFDPLEMNNRVNDPSLKKVRERLSGCLNDFMRETNDPLLRGDVPLPADGKMIDRDGRSNKGPFVPGPWSP